MSVSQGLTIEDLRLVKSNRLAKCSFLVSLLVTSYQYEYGVHCMDSRTCDGRMSFSNSSEFFEKVVCDV